MRIEPVEYGNTEIQGAESVALYFTEAMADGSEKRWKAVMHGPEGEALRARLITRLMGVDTDASDIKSGRIFFEAEFELVVTAKTMSFEHLTTVPPKEG